MAESLLARQFVRRAADGGELQPLSALIIQKCNLLIVGAAHPAARHDIGHGADVRIVDLAVRRSGNFLFLIRAAGNESVVSATTSAPLRAFSGESTVTTSMSSFSVISAA